jgi:hypothetical protein
MPDNSSQWYSVRCVFQSPTEDGFAYEERVTLWQAKDIDDAIALAETEAIAYEKEMKAEYTGMAQAYWLFAPPKNGMEVFSLVRQSQLASDDYLDRFFDTGDESQGRWTEE